MTAEEWETVRKNTDNIRDERDRLRVLLNEARLALPADHNLQPNICAALGLRQEQPA